MNRTPVVLIHGSWLHVSSWESWAGCFADRGFSVCAPGWHVFANAVRVEEAAKIFERYVGVTPRRLLTDLGCQGATRHSRATADVANTARGPLISGQEDRIVADSVTREVYKLYGDSVAASSLKQFADRGHSLVVDSGWRALADHVLGWLAEHGIRAECPGC